MLVLLFCITLDTELFTVNRAVPFVVIVVRTYIIDSQPGFCGTPGCREHFLGVLRDVEIKNK
jgi:hypothetical protein